jgi:hypothetical protein
MRRDKTYLKHDLDAIPNIGKIYRGLEIKKNSPRMWRNSMPS